INAEEGSYQYTDIITRFPKGSQHRHWIEQLKDRSDDLARINFVAKKYNLTLVELCRLLDEDGVFTPTGELHLDQLQQQANLLFRQTQKLDDDRVRHVARAETATVKTAEQHSDRFDEEIMVDAEYCLEVPAMFK